jgi:hypothetical protein
MANKKIWLGILVMVLVFGMTVAGCGSPGLSGTWGLASNSGRPTIKFSGRNFETDLSGIKPSYYSRPFDKSTKGTYSVTDGKIRLHITAIKNFIYATNNYGDWESWSGPDVVETLIRTEGSIKIGTLSFTR